MNKRNNFDMEISFMSSETLMDEFSGIFFFRTDRHNHYSEKSVWNSVCLGVFDMEMGEEIVDV